MKLLFISFHFEYADQIEEILDRNQVQNYVRYPMLESKDIDGKHFGTQVFPGNSSVVHAFVQEDLIDLILEELREFKHAKTSHEHLQAYILPVERSLT